MLGFPLWLRITHFLNIIFMTLLLRSGLQILADHPKLYWNDDCRPDSEWIRFTKKKLPKDGLWTSMDEAERINPVIGITGGRHNIGSARRWHFLTVIFWITNGLVYVGFLFATGEWVRLIPRSWSIFPESWHTLLIYASFHIPPLSAFTPYDPLQQLTYFIVVFILSPFMIVTGLAMSPAILARFPWYSRIFGGRQPARSLHFLGMVALMVFVIFHLTLVAIVNGRLNILNITLGNPDGNWNLAVAIFSAGILFIILFNAWATWYTLRNERKLQNAFDPFINIFTSTLAKLRSRQHYTKDDISPYFRVNGRPPENDEWKRHADREFADWKLSVYGLVKNPQEFSLIDLKKDFSKREQITKHNCIQGWSGVAEWGGVRMSDLLAKIEPLPNARYVVFRAFDEDEQGRGYYETFTIEEMTRPQSLLAYEMNWETLPINYGAPLRVRAESKLGFKMVKYLKSIEITDDYSKIGEGKSGYKEDTQFFDRVAAI